jgi:flagellar protein FliJ
VSDYRFRLQSIVQLRERERDAAIASYREALTARNKLQSQVDEIMKEHAAQQPIQVDSILNRVDTQRLIESQRYQMFLIQQANHLRSQIKMIDDECEKRRLRLVKREQAVRSLEKLKEKQQTDWENQQAARQQMSLDQWAAFRYWKEASS